VFGKKTIYTVLTSRFFRGFSCEFAGSYKCAIVYK